MCRLLKFSYFLVLLSESATASSDNSTDNVRINNFTEDYEEHLVIRLLNNGYRKDVRPGVWRNGVKEALKITTMYQIFRILGTDDRLETLSIVVGVAQEWWDQRLVWNSSQYGNITLLTVDPETIWTPQFYLPNLAMTNQGDTTKRLKALVNLTIDEISGEITNRVSLYTYALIQERCDFGMAYFPFDNQHCLICGNGAEYPHDAFHEALEPTFDQFEGGGGWYLIDVASARSFRVNDACFAITVQRRCVYYVVNLFLPTIIICVLNTIGLFASIHTASEEMEFSSLGQTTLLSLSVLMLTVADQTTKGASQVSLLGIFFLAMICQTLLASLTAILLKKRMRDVEKMLSSRLRSSWANFDKHYFIRMHGTKVCMWLHLSLILCITAIVLATGFSNVRPAIDIEQ